MNDVVNTAADETIAANRRVPTVALGITGSIAAFKAVEIVRLLTSQRVRVIPVLTRGGSKFVGPVVFTGICKEPAHIDMWDHRFAGEMHIDIAAQIDVLVIAPATADMIARLAVGRADDLLSALGLAFHGPLVLAPAMHPNMWGHPATQRNCQTLCGDSRVRFVGPVIGKLANGEIGLGRMADPQQIVDAVRAALAPQDLLGYHVVVTAGPTVEDLDPVRFISNRSSGKMGFALAQQAASRGAKVTLISGPVALATPSGVSRVNVRSALQMKQALYAALGQDMKGADAVIMAAAVGDYRSKQVLSTKMDGSANAIALELISNPDILAELGSKRKALRESADPVLIGFAVQCGSDAEMVQQATKKLHKKQVDMVVANKASDAFGADTNKAVLIKASQAQDSLPQAIPVDIMSKQALADRILQDLAQMLKVRQPMEKQL